MKAMVQDRYGPADVLEFREIPTPVPGDGEVRIRVRAAGVDPGVWHLMTGLPYATRLGFGLRKPRTPIRGLDVAGRVERVGRNVTRFQPGDEVFGTCAGSFAEFAIARPDRLARKPERLTFEQAAALPVSAVTALQAIRDAAKVRPGQRVAIIGAGGGVGSFAVQLAKAYGAEVTAVCGPAKGDLVRSIGADHVIDYTSEDFTDGTARYDVIVDTAGNRSLSRLRRALASSGTLVIVGGEGGAGPLGGFGRQIRAMLLSPFVGHKLRGLMSLQRQSDLEKIAELVAEGKVTPVIGRTFPLAAAGDAIRYVTEGHTSGKVVLSVG